MDDDALDRPAWYAIKTRGRSEKRVAQRLETRGIESYCPVVEKEREWSDRKKLVLFPMFPTYVFGHFALRRTGDVLYTPGVASIVKAEGDAVPVRPEELEAVRRLEGGIRETGEEPTQVDFFTPGDPVKVVEGPFEGMTGVLLEDRDGVRVSVKLSAIEQAMSIVLPRDIVAPVP